MRFAHLFPPANNDEQDETCHIGNKTISLKDVTFKPLIEHAVPDGRWIDGGSALLFGTPTRAFAIIKVCVVQTTATRREAIATHTYLASITTDGENYIVRGQALENPEPRITTVLNQIIPKADVGADATPELLIDPLRTLCEHAVSDGGIHDGSTRFTNPLLQNRVKPACSIAKTSGLLTSRSRPVGMALLSHAPAGCWTATLSEGVTLCRLHDRASHVFLIENANDAMLSLMRAWSADMTFPGYPYPLVLADQIARVSNNERDAWKVVLASDEQAAKVITDELKASDAHAMLEHILYGKEF